MTEHRSRRHTCSVILAGALDVSRNASPRSALRRAVRVRNTLCHWHQPLGHGGTRQPSELPNGHSAVRLDAALAHACDRRPGVLEVLCCVQLFCVP
jgi:hypothetical protein